MIHYTCRAFWKIALVVILVFATLSTGSKTVRTAEATAASPYVGEIQLFPYGYAPTGWTFAAGQTLGIQNNMALFSLIGTAYGGNGQTTFALPNLTALPVPDGMGYYIASNGNYISSNSDSTNGAFAGQVNLFASVRVPGGWLKLDGSTINMANYPQLSSVINPSGSPTYTLPDIRLANSNLYFAVATTTTTAQNGTDLRSISNDDKYNLLYGETLSFLKPMQTNFFPADGALVSTISQPALFSLLGHKFGGNNNQTFGLPNFNSNPYSFSYYTSAEGVYPQNSMDGSAPTVLASGESVYSVETGLDKIISKVDLLRGTDGSGVSIRTQPKHGVIQDGGGILVYSADKDYSGPDSFTVRTYNAYGFATGYTTINMNIVAPIPPVVSGVNDGGRYNRTVNPVFGTGTATLNGFLFTSGTAVTAEGTYTLIATNSYGSTQVQFTIDLTPPTVSGVTNGGRYTVPPMITFSDGTATLNGAAFVSGGRIIQEGNYTLIVTDAANNSSTIAFSYYAPRQLLFDSGGGTSVATQNLFYGDHGVEPQAPTRTGYTFAGWYSDAALTQRFNFANTPVTKNAQLYANWTLQSYTVTFDVYQGDHANVPDQTIPYGTRITRPADPVRAGYTFTDWYADAAHTQPFDFETLIATPVTVYAGWSTNRYKASFNSNEGTAVGEQLIEYGSPVQEPQQPSRTGYTFTGWYSDAGLQQRFDFATSTVQGNVQLYAGWESILYTVSFDTPGGSDIPDIHIRYGDPLTLPSDPTSDTEGQVFAGWFADSQLTVPFDFSVPILSNVTLYAKWAARVHQISFDTGEGSAIAAQTAAYGDLLSRPSNPERTGYTFAGWYTNPGHDQPFDFAKVTVVTDMTLYAKWDIAVRTVSFDTDLGSMIQAKEVNHGERISPPSDPVRTGYAFTGWYTDIARSLPFDFATATVNEDITLYAGWKLVPLPSGGNTGSNGNTGNGGNGGGNESGGGSNSNSNPSSNNSSGNPPNDTSATQPSVSIPATSGSSSPADGGGNTTTIVTNFSDIEDHWASSSIREAAALGIVKGYADGNFHPKAHVTRAEFTAMLVRMLKPAVEKGEPDTGKRSFSDMAQIGLWAREDVAVASAMGWIQGDASGNFRPNASITRAEMAVMISRAKAMIDVMTGSSFKDAKAIPVWASQAVAQMQQSGLMEGRVNGAFDSLALTTRAEATQVLMRAREK